VTIATVSQPPGVHSTLDEWLGWQLSVHTQEIQLGLARVQAVADRLGLLPLNARCAIVAGTNGKGSTAALAAGLIGARGRVGVYTSPHLWRYNERIVVDGVAASDGSIVAAFAEIDVARGDTPLTYFEFATLAALVVFARAAVEYVVLEVGLGGRLDAANIVDADVALLTPIGLDHCDWLGPDRESIGYEKAGVMRAGQPAFCSDRAMPASIAQHAEQIGTPLQRIGEDFDIASVGDHWQWHDASTTLALVPHSAVLPDNLALAVAGVRALGVSVTAADAERACQQQARLPGRREVVDGPIPIIYDVGHNVEAVDQLLAMLHARPVAGCTHVVIGMLADKPIEAVAQRLLNVADYLYPVGLDCVNARGLGGGAMAQRLGLDAANGFSSPAVGLSAAQEAARTGDRIVVCGSFFTVAQARRPDDE